MSQVERIPGAIDGSVTFAITLTEGEQDAMDRELLYELEASLREVVAAATGHIDPEVDAVRGKQVLWKFGRQISRFVRFLIALAVLVVAIRVVAYVAIWAWGLI